jgi:histidinol-phosphate aminotransferase
MRGQLLQRIKRCAGFRDPDQLDFLELMLAHEAARIASGGAGFFAKACRRGDEALRQAAGGENLVPMERGERHLRRGDEEEIGLLVEEHRIGEFRELTGRPHRRASDQVGRRDLRIPRLRRSIEKEIDDAAGESRAGPAQEAKAASGELGGAREIENAQSFADRVMRLRLEVERARRALGMEHDIAGFADAVGHRVVDHVWGLREARVDLGPQGRGSRRIGGDLRIEFGDPRPEALGFALSIGGLGDRIGQDIFFRSPSLQDRQGGAQVVIEREEVIDERRLLTAPEGRAPDPFRIVAQEEKIEHPPAVLRAPLALLRARRWREAQRGNPGLVIQSTPHIEALPAVTPFLGPETLARAVGIPPESLLRLGANESAFGASPLVARAIERELPRIPYYGDPDLYDLREALAAKHGCSPNEIFVANGIDEVLALCLRAYLGDGGLALAASGTYPTFFYLLAGHGGRCERTDYVGTRPDIEQLAALAQHRKPAVVYLANPDNPGGGLQSRAALSSFLAAIPPETLILLDEAYAEFVTVDELLPLRPESNLQPNLVRMRTFSKVYGLAGMRVGYAIAGSAITATIEKIRQHYGVARLSSAAALAALQDDAFVGRVVRETASGREAYHSLAHELGLRSYPSSTNFVLFECGSVALASRLLPALLKRGIFVRKPSSGALASCIRVTVGTPREREVFASHLTAVLASLAFDTP